MVPRGVDGARLFETNFPTIGDDGVAKMAEGMFLNLQPHFCSLDYWKL
ncbi:hypothetical protein Hanom_Chr09g00771971 [Helianthus anomalus]